MSVVSVQVSGIIRFQVSGVSIRMTEDRKQKWDRMFHPPVIIICFLSSDFSPLTPDTRNQKDLSMISFQNKISILFYQYGFISWVIVGRNFRAASVQMAWHSFFCTLVLLCHPAAGHYRLWRMSFQVNWCVVVHHKEHKVHEDRPRLEQNWLLCALCVLRGK